MSELALTIFEPNDSLELQAALGNASKKPEVFRSLYDRFSGRIPTADEPIRAYLIRDLGFSKAGAEETIAALRETDAYLTEVLGTSGAPDENVYLAINEPRVPEASSPIDVQGSVQSSSSIDLVRIPLTKDCTAELRLVGTASERALSNLIRHIELMKEVWTEE
ncbi:hypothetical protein GV829_05480 [Sphingomonas lacunae]|uniref:Uncharacterized protein n=1 Tax=Sphingomonas lacunae TaxID=2698828 RepID=A0A6M4AYA4_9SPHN|nr:hypothetical protein [Sphingomonas lacunae]QJQ31971.1 hypothetical protein GV829_05480 [Sphingomonas lacunae]